uniref:tRNA pseudouridine synthase n=1 Tax=Populus trichocarpa TaxID=3694 RepID=A0A2K2AJE0_POPTR
MTSDKRQQAVVCLLKIEFRFRYDPFNTDLFSSPFNCPLKWKKPGKLDGLVTAVDDVSVPGKYQAGPLSKSLGEKFYGFASEAETNPTVEVNFVEKTRLLVGDKKEIQYSRCGRTDKGVSAVGQVIALYLRSKLKDVDAQNKHSWETFPEEQDGENGYVRMLNGVLPKDIELWAGVLFQVTSVQGKKFMGEHDFRNLCKTDAVKCRIVGDMFKGHQLCAIKIKGSAFLLHQVCCMVAVLLMIGQGLESPDLIDALLDTRRTPRKPQYLMAPEIPLVLLPVSLKVSSLHVLQCIDARQALHGHLENECRLYQLRAAAFLGLRC